MTVSSATVVNRYAGNGSTTTFAISPIDFTSNSEIQVILRDESVTPATETVQTDPTEYSITGGDPGTNVEMVTAPTSDEVLVIRRVTPKTQATDYLETGEFPADTHEDALDKATRLNQERSEEIGRCAKLPKTSSITDLEIGEPVADQFLRWNSGATALEPASIASLGGFSFPGGNGILVKDGSNTASARTITGTSDEIDVADGDGVSGNPTIGISDNPVLPGTGGVQLPRGNTAQRPGTPTNGTHDTTLMRKILRFTPTETGFPTCKQGLGLLTWGWKRIPPLRVTTPSRSLVRMGMTYPLATLGML